ncbi:hypothetical protein [uncultured Alistipes sp.]|uniref:hypothetical protein n=1 Tax=Alistipes sp. TaxID=1872444 RepID=UPI00266B9B1C|nr:hypothetical protein [uncultured Alistipes sp.]
MAEYLCALDFGLDLIAGEEQATPQSIADLFCTCFLHWETDYRQQQGFTEASDLYPIFGGYLFADVLALKRYRLLAGQEILRHELIPAEDSEARTFYRNNVFIRCSQSLPALFCDPVFYATLRKGLIRPSGNTTSLRRDSASLSKNCNVGFGVRKPS